MKNPQITSKVYYKVFFDKDRDGFIHYTEPYLSLKDASVKATLFAKAKATVKNVRIVKIYEFTEIVKIFK